MSPQRRRDAAALVDRLARSPKYRALAPETIELVVATEEPRARDGKDLERRARLVLHRAAALYLTRASPADLEAELAAGRLDGAPADEVRTWCRDALATHASTAERVPDLDRFYGVLLDLAAADDGPIVDLACALNPLSLPWLRDRTAASYAGYDFNAAFVSLGRAFAAAVGDAAATFHHRDVLQGPEHIAGELALLLKTYHCIENRERGAALALVAALRTPVVVVSFPPRSFGGRTGRFVEAHGPDLRERAEAEGWTIRTAELPTEVLWAIDKRTAAP